LTTSVLSELEDDDDDDSAGLFADEYGVATAAGTQTNNAGQVATRPLDLLPALLEGSFSSSITSTVELTNDLVTMEFVEDYLQLQAQEIEAHAKKGSGSPDTVSASIVADEALAKADMAVPNGTMTTTTTVKPAPQMTTAAAEKVARLLLERCIHRLNQALHATSSESPFEGSTLSNRLLAVSTLLSISHSVRAIVPQVLCNDKVVRSNGKTHSSCSMRPLWEAVAYVVPAVGSERLTGLNDPKVATPFYQQLDATDNFPTKVFQKPDAASRRRNDVFAVMDESRKLMNHARLTAHSLLRVAFKFGDKLKVFNWLGSVIHQQ
jgi:hypothetical protein